jgi:hypothetical protein
VVEGALEPVGPLREGDGDVVLREEVVDATPDLGGDAPAVPDVLDEEVDGERAAAVRRVRTGIAARWGCRRTGDGGPAPRRP